MASLKQKKLEQNKNLEHLNHHDTSHLFLFHMAIPIKHQTPIIQTQHESRIAVKRKQKKTSFHPAPEPRDLFVLSGHIFQKT